MYRIILEQRVAKDIENLPNFITHSILEKIENLKDNPRPDNVKKLLEKDGWRIRVGDYRILYTVDDKLKWVSIYRIKHRKDVYR